MEAELRELIKQKDQIEKQIENLTIEIDAIDQTKNFKQNLTDAEGFPRADLDFGQLANYRTLKRRKAELNNDHLALMKEIQGKLFALHSSYPKDNKHEISETYESKNTALNFKKQKKEEKIVEVQPKKKIDYLTPFSKVSIVFEGSPAEKAGLKVGDLLSEMGEVNIYSMDWQKQIAGVVREGIALKVVVMRKVDTQQKVEGRIFGLKDGNNYEKIELELIPGKWEGRGMLGCKIDPISS